MQATDFAIFQRDENNRASVPFAGALSSALPQNAAVFARALREDDRLPLIDWTRADISENRMEWRIELSLPAGGLYILEACSCEEGTLSEWSHRVKIVRHVGVGELWLLAGQSNMSGYGRGSVYDPPKLGVHLFANDGKWRIATHPLNDSIATIYPENAEYGNGTSPALAFARALSDRLHMPVGIVQASLGGSALSEWNPDENGRLTRAMLRRIERTGRVGGILWHQGCSDANSTDKAPTYLARFKCTVGFWRSALGDIPIATVQINRYIVGTDDVGWGMLRESQRVAEREIDKLITVSSIDLALSDGIHNSSAANVALGERLASAVLKSFYGLPGQTSPNPLRCEYVSERSVRVVFENSRVIMPYDNLGDGLNVEDASGLIDCESCVSADNSLIVTTVRPYALPARFHAYWTCAPTSEVPRDVDGMPMLSCYDMPIEQN